MSADNVVTARCEEIEPLSGVRAETFAEAGADEPVM
jgi:hypothetical protein